MKRLSIVVAALALFGNGAVSAAGLNVEGLASTCNNCHGLNGVSVGKAMPSIGGLPEIYLKQLMLQWKSGERFSASMGRLLKGYSDEEIGALASYFAQKPWVPSAQKLDANQLAQGREAVERCTTCHGDTGVPDDAETPRLTGQWAKSMELEMMKYRDGVVAMPHKKMRNNAKKLDDASVAAAAAYYAGQK
jgi:sulfide dehydrogenase cytochrome subunit